MKYASNQQASKHNGKRSPADPRNATGRGRAALQQKVRGMNYEDGANALSPRNGNPLSPSHNSLSPVQKKGEGAQEQNVHDLAAQGTQGAGDALPHLDKIQAAFGSHDVTGVKAQVGGPAKDACAGMGAEAYASGNTVAFSGSPTLHTAAHEAAHVVQQRAGVSLKGGVGKAGDPYEQHADAVADLVVQGKSAEGLLGTMAGGGQTGGVQRKESKSEPKSESVPTKNESPLDNLQLANAAMLETMQTPPDASPVFDKLSSFFVGSYDIVTNQYADAIKRIPDHLVEHGLYKNEMTFYRALSDGSAVMGGRAQWALNSAHLAAQSYFRTMEFLARENVATQNKETGDMVLDSTALKNDLSVVEDGMCLTGKSTSSDMPTHLADHNLLQEELHNKHYGLLKALNKIRARAQEKEINGAQDVKEDFDTVAKVVDNIGSSALDIFVGKPGGAIKAGAKAGGKESGLTGGLGDTLRLFHPEVQSLQNKIKAAETKHDVFKELADAYGLEQAFLEFHTAAKAADNHTTTVMVAGRKNSEDYQNAGVEVDEKMNAANGSSKNASPQGSDKGLAAMLHLSSIEEAFDFLEHAETNLDQVLEGGAIGKGESMVHCASLGDWVTLLNRRKSLSSGLRHPDKIRPSLATPETQYRALHNYIFSVYEHIVTSRKKLEADASAFKQVMKNTGRDGKKTAAKRTRCKALRAGGKR
jgi:hypothetical protein